MSSKYDQLLALINSQNPNIPAFSLTNVEFSNPVPSGILNRNTKITISPLAGSGFAGHVDLFYNRINFQELDNNVWLFSDVQFTQTETIDLLNTFRNCIYLLDSDIMPLNIPSMRTGDIVVMSLKATDDSVNWVGETNLSLFLGFPTINSFLNQLVNVDFAAPNYLS